MKASGCCSPDTAVCFQSTLLVFDEEFQRQQHLSFSAGDAVLDYLDKLYYREEVWQEFLQAELLALPGWAGLMRALKKTEPSSASRCALLVDGFLAVRLTMLRAASRTRAAETTQEESPLKTQEKRRLSRAARIYDAARVVRLSANEVTRLSDAEWTTFTNEVKAFNGLERRRVLHLAYERWHEREILRGLASHRKYRSLTDGASRQTADRPLKYSSALTSVRNPCVALSRKLTRWWRPSVLPATSVWPWTIRESMIRTAPLFAR